MSAAWARFTGWLEAADVDDAVRRFRRLFFAIWLVYDVVDVVWGMTERSRDWFPHARDGGLLGVQIALVVCEAALLFGRMVWPLAIAAAAARWYEGYAYFPLNDFYFVAVVALWLAHSEGGPFGRKPAAGHPPRWVRDVLLAQVGWVYFATAMLKLNPDWLGGGHLFVRTQYLALAGGWPYPAPIAEALANLRVEAVLAKIGVAGELALAGVLVARRPYWLAVVLAVAIHAVGALLTNVWFFSATMIAAVALLLPRAAVSPAASGAE